jgi:hypothetical protein
MSTRNTILSLTQKQACFSQATEVEVSEVTPKRFREMTVDPLPRFQKFGPYVITATQGESLTTVYAPQWKDVKEILHRRFITGLDTSAPKPTELPKSYTALPHRAGYQGDPLQHGMSVTEARRSRSLLAAQATQSASNLSADYAASAGSRGDGQKGPPGTAAGYGESSMASGVDDQRTDQQSENQQSEEGSGSQSPEVWRDHLNQRSTW